MIGNCSDRLCVCVSLMWEFYDPQDESKLLHADMVLIDEEGGSAHAQIYPPLAVVFKPMIKEGNVYNISYVQIRKANRMYKPVDNDIMIGFTKWTTIEALIEVPPAFPEIVYSLTPFDQLTTLVDIREYFIDVIGAVTMISDVATIRTKMRQTQTAKRSVTIQNESCTPLEVVLWGEQATSFPADQISIAGQDSLQIIIFVGTLARSYAGTTSLTGGSSCKWYVNPQVPEATSLAASIKGAQLCLLLVRRSVCRGFLPLSIRKYLKSNACIHSSMRKLSGW
ncbi:Replication protein A DNA-binding subunit B [Zea mays]|uniref:Replication protein A DNA-binding subunit B n=1 Tax=Zea mays TaxID=4577 RepID=A0A317Y4H9_MAIZE|nr:Replication protein A DNA-binding subunit B [Zea mays]